ncbi:MAG: DUF1640 domain-containing protein [Alphaproteobacteria bacterium]|nr:DUF1640 domain-containing protein [Alphaproteobacteria bacterium]
MIHFDTLKFARRLQAGGFTADQATATAEAFADFTDLELATKANLEAESAALRADLKAESAALRADLKAESATLRADMKAESAALRADMKVESAALRADLARTETSIRDELAALRTDLARTEASIRDEMKTNETTLRSDLRGDIVSTEHRLDLKIAEVNTRIAEAKTDMLKTLMPLVVTMSIINIVAVYGAMFGLAKLLGH